MSLEKSKIWLSSPHMGGNELNYIKEAFDSNWIAPLGPNVDGFENSLANYCEKKHCAVLNSGTSAIHLALIMLGVGPGDYVICQSFTFSASANPIRYLGATPVFIDSESDTWNMDPVLLEKAIVDLSKGHKGAKLCQPEPVEDGDGWAQRRKGTDLDNYPPCNMHPAPCTRIKAIIPVHLYGMPAKMDQIMAIANKYNIPVIEDAAEALGSRYKHKPAGSKGLMGILSFNGNKIITTSGGGALLSDSRDLIAQARFLSTQARDSAPHYQHSQIGYNYRMSNIVAGIGRGQLEVIDERVNQRRANNLFYRESLSNIPGVSFQSEPSYDFFSNYWLTTITVDPFKTGGITRENIRHSLAEENIEARPLWKPLHLQPVFKKFPSFVNGISEKLFEQGLCLPSGSNLSNNDLNRVVENILKAMKRLRSIKTAALHSSW
jgi:dTDP-4-amino-4,6-dideoxygalactose transaminase